MVASSPYRATVSPSRRSISLKYSQQTWARDMAQRVAHGEKVEGVVRQGQLFSPTEYEVRRQLGSGDLQHTFAWIEAGDVLCRAKDGCRFNSHQTGAAGHIEQMMRRAQAVFLQRPTPVGSSTLEEAPAHHGIVMPGSSVEQTVDELRLLLGCAVMLGQRGVGKHRHKLAQSQPDTSRKPGRAIWQRLLL